MENKTDSSGHVCRSGKYFKYAIGEIILVVIGILIALSINNWNEDRKNKISWRSYTKSLIQDLEKDIITLKMVTNYIKNDSINSEKQNKRLSSKNATIDTLIKIARYEINPDNKSYRPPNNKTFLAMQANMSIELFDDKTYSLLLELHNTQIIAESIIKENNNVYLVQISNFATKYSLSEFNAITGHLSEEAWQNVDADDLYRKVEGLFSIKKVMNRYTYGRYMEVLEATEKALNRLKIIQQDEN
jgi:hypothetical protein